MFAIEPAAVTLHLVAAVVAAKWAMDLGFSQARQLLWLVAGLAAPPLVLLILYTRLQYQRADVRRAAAAA
jgi:hypothetical protein